MEKKKDWYKKLSFKLGLIKTGQLTLSDYMVEVSKKIDSLEDELITSNKIPHTCPVCSGIGFVPNGYYRTTSQTWSSNSTSPDRCKTCNGTGIITL